jgi:hypothetical protein
MLIDLRADAGASETDSTVSRVRLLVARCEFTLEDG